MRPPTTPATTNASSYTMIPLRAPFPGAPPRYVAVATSKNPASMSRVDGGHPHKKNPASIATKEAEEKPSSQGPKAAPTAVATPTATKLKPNPTRIPLSRAQSAPLQEMREATVAVRDNSRLGRDSTADRRDAVELHPLKFWEM